MPDSTVVAGIFIPSRDPLFLGVVALHVVAAILCVIAGGAAMFSDKRRGWHTQYGTAYFRALVVVVSSMAVIAAMRFREDYHLFIIGCASLGLAAAARRAIRGSGPRRVRFHVFGMGSSYVLLLVAFYIDNGPHLPLWRDIPSSLHWLLPAGVGCALMVWVLLRHSLVRAEKAAAAQTGVM